MSGCRWGNRAGVPVHPAVAKYFGGITAVEDVTFDVHPGQVTGLIGNNGAGKSPMVRILAGVQQPDAEELLWQGSHVRIANPGQACDLGIATVYQELALADDLDATANIFLNKEISWGWGPFRFKRNAAMRRAARELLDRFAIQLPPDVDDARAMSGSQRQGVAIARALAGGNRLLLLDEPTAALGVNETHHVEELILRLRENDVAVILVRRRSRADHAAVRPSGRSGSRQTGRRPRAGRAEGAAGRLADRRRPSTPRTSPELASSYTGACSREG